ncbi:hypothetical protein ACWEGQ_00055 [Streptomyces seoulensis]
MSSLLPVCLPAGVLVGVLLVSVVYSAVFAVRARHRRRAGRPSGFLPPYVRDPVVEERVARQQSVVLSAELIVAAEYARVIAEK